MSSFHYYMSWLFELDTCLPVKSLNSENPNVMYSGQLHSSLLPLLISIFYFVWRAFCLQVLCDRHFGGINYPLGGVGGIAKSLAKGLVDQGSEILYKANVKSIITEQGKAVS